MSYANLSQIVDPDGLRAKAALELERRLDAAAADPVAALARGLAECGFSDAPSAARALWAAADRSKQKWAPAADAQAKESGVGPSRMSWAIEEGAAPGVSRVFARLCLRAQRALAGTDDQRPTNMVDRMRQHLVANMQYGSFDGERSPAKICALFCQFAFTGRWDEALRVSRHPLFDWTGMTRRNLTDELWSGPLPGRLPQELDGASSPLQRFVACALNSSARLGDQPGLVAFSGSETLHDANFKALLQNLLSLVERNAMRDQLDATRPIGDNSRMSDASRPAAAPRSPKRV
jgi:hypothetical protein